MTCPKCHHPNSPAQLFCRGCQEPLRRAKLRVVEQSGKEQHLELTHQTFTIGREVQNDLALADEAVSRRHACLRLLEGAYRVEDLESKNGMFVNGAKASLHQLVELDCVQIGATRIYYLLSEVARSASAVRTGSTSTNKTLTRRSTPHATAPHSKAEALFQRTLAPLLQGALHLAQAARATLWLPDSSGDLIPRLSTGEKSAGRHLVLEQQMALKVFHSGGVMVRAHEEATEMLGEGLSTAPDFSYQILGVPLRLVKEDALEKPQGALLLQSHAASHRLAPAKLERLRLFLAQAEASLSRVQTAVAILRDLEAHGVVATTEAAALAMQRLILPTTIPRVFGYDFAAWHHPAEAVSGDYVELLALSSGEVLLVVGDVAGKGLAAATTIFALQTALHLLARFENSLEKFLATLNRVAQGVGGSAIFTTLFLGKLDPERRALHYLNAGHTPGLFVHSCEATPTVELLHSNVAALGVLEELRAEPKLTLMPPGSALVLFTDGLTEAMNDRNEYYGLPRLTERIVSALMSSPQTSAARVLEHVRADLTLFAADFHAKVRRHDDQAALVVRVK